MADWIGSNHTEIITTPAAFLEVLPQVVHDIESYDITTVRASVGNWFVAREISRRSEAKVVFNGDGADELFGSYLYFFRAPNDEAYETEVTRLLDDLYQFDVLRSDRSISSHGLEPRTPFLDKQFVATVRSIGTQWLRPIPKEQPLSKPEKWLLRSAFEESDLLPPTVLWRQKEAFSDGVSDSEKPWYQRIQDALKNDAVLLARFQNPTLFSHLPPPRSRPFTTEPSLTRSMGSNAKRRFPISGCPAGPVKRPTLVPGLSVFIRTAK